MPADPNRVESLFHRALGLPPSDRAAFLAATCGDDAELRGRVERLLAAADSLGEPETSALPADPPTVTFGDSSVTADHTPPPDVDTVIAGKYKLLQQIGEGGMGTVWMADQTQPIKRRVAVKLIRVDRGNSATILARFEAERQAIALMDHPHIAKLLDAGTTDAGQPYFVMELVKGVPLTEYCDAHKLSVQQRLSLFQQICSAVQHAHQKGIIHRDLKPTNILVESHDGKPVPKVIDFGLAKATSGLQLTEHSLFTAFGSVMGTPLYMAPEQATFNAIDVDTRADIYALGVILYELLTGTTPLTRDTMKKAALDEMLKLVREQEAPTPSSRLSSADALPSVAANRQSEPVKLGRFVKGELDWIVLKALSKERDRRYETANGFAKDIERFLNHEPVQAGPVGAAYKLRKFVRRNRGQVIAASLVLFALVAGIAGTTVGLFEAKKQERLAVAAQHAEAERAEGERLAKLDAQEKEKLAVAAAEAEKAAKLDADARRREAERNLAFAKKGNAILGSVFAGLDPKANYATVAELRNVLRDNLAKAVRELDGSAIGDPLEVATMQNTLGLSLLSLGEANLAIAVFGKALATRKERRGADHPDTLIGMGNLALGYQDAGKLDLAVPLYEETLKLKKAKLGADHPDTLNSMGNLAAGYQAAGKFDLALPLFEETLKLTKAKLGADHPDTLRSMNNLALGYQDAGKIDQALPLLEETLKLTKATLGADHPDTLTSMNNLAAGYRDAGKLDLALPLHEETLKLKKAKLGADHPETLRSMGNLASSYREAGKLDLALPLLEETLRLKKAKLGADHPETLISMGNLATGYRAAKRLDKSLPLFEEALKLREKKLGRQHPDTLSAMAELGVDYKDVGRLAEALPLLEEAYRASKRYARLRWIGLELLDGHVKSHKPKEAVALVAELLVMARATLPKDSPQLAGALAQHGLALLQLMAYADAEPLLRECLPIREKTQPEAWSTFNTHSMLGGALLGQKKHAEAEPLLLKGYEGMKQREKTIPPEGRDRLPEAADRLIELYTATNKPDELKKWRAERAKYPPELAPPPREAKR